MKKVALHGSYFGYNFGDTLLCALFRQWIKDLGSAEVVVPLASKKNCTLIGADKRGPLAFLSCSHLIFCGGGYFGDSGKKSVRWNIRNYFRHFLIAEIAMLLGKRIFILGTGVGPVTSNYLRGRLVRLVNYAEQVIVRDEESKSFLEQIGVEREVTVDMDAATYMTRDFFADTPVPWSPGAQSNSGPGDARIVAVHLTNFDAPQWMAMAQVVADFFQKHQELVPVLITDSLTRSGKPAAQDKASKALNSMIGRAAQFTYSGNPRELCKLLDSVDFVITNKLHVGIVSVVLGKQVAALPQHVKTPRFYRQIGLSVVCVEESQPEGLRTLLDQWSSTVGYPTVVLPPRRNIYANALAVGVYSES